MNDPDADYAPITMAPAEPGWWLESPPGELHPVVAWAVTRNFANTKAPNRTAPMVVDYHGKGLRAVLDPPGTYRLAYDLDESLEARFPHHWSAL